MIISASKSDMMCFNDMAAAMKKTEAEWTTAGNDPKPRNFKSVFGVNLDRIYENWAEHQMPPVGFVRSKRIIPAGYAQIYGSEKVSAKDLAWNEGWTRWEKPQKIGEPAERYHFVIRKSD